MERCNSLLEAEYRHLTFNQETGALAICKECFEEVKNRDLWARN